MNPLLPLPALLALELDDVLGVQMAAAFVLDAQHRVVEDEALDIEAPREELQERRLQFDLAGVEQLIVVPDPVLDR